MLYRLQKEVLVAFFILISAYPSYRTYKKYQNHVKKSAQRTDSISKKLVNTLIKEDSAHTENKTKFNLNDVSWEALMLIPGIGEGTAKKIITYRMKNGKFKRLEDILNIKGIGKKTYMKLKPYVYVK